MSNRLDQEREKTLQPIRMTHARRALERLGIDITYADHTRFDFIFKGHKVQFWPYSGWHTGKTIKDGRGLQHLLCQLKP